MVEASEGAIVRGRELTRRQDSRAGGVQRMVPSGYQRSGKAEQRQKVDCRSHGEEVDQLDGEAQQSSTLQQLYILLRIPSPQSPVVNCSRHLQTTRARRQIDGNEHIALAAAQLNAAKPADADGVHGAELGDNVARQEPTLGASASHGRGAGLAAAM